MGKEKQTFDESKISKSITHHLQFMEVTFLPINGLIVISYPLQLYLLYKGISTSDIFLSFYSFVILWWSWFNTEEIGYEGSFLIYSIGFTETFGVKISSLPKGQRKLLFNELLAVEVIDKKTLDCALVHFGLQKEDFTGSNV